jgi:hypothetical protein
MVMADREGRFTIRALKPGTYRLFAHVLERTVDLGDVQAPADGLVLTVRDE